MRRLALLVVVSQVFGLACSKSDSKKAPEPAPAVAESAESRAQPDPIPYRPPPPPPKPTWEAFSQTDKMDDSTVIGIKLLADEHVTSMTGQPFQPRLWVACGDKKTNVRIDLGAILDTQVRSWESDDAYGYTSGASIRLRLDQDKPISNFGTPSNDGTQVFLRNPIPVLKKMVGKSALLVEYTPIASASRTVTFTITGIGEAMADLRKACHW